MKLARPLLVLSLLALLGPGVARATVNSTAVYVKSGDRKAVSDATVAYLDQWKKGKDVDPAFWTGALKSRRLLVLGPAKGWTVVMDAPGVPGDPGLARHLAEALKTTASLVDLRGASLSWFQQTFVKDAEKSSARSPSEGFGGAPLDGPMPAYEDVEQVAWKHLAKLGIPASRRHLTLTELKPLKEKGGIEATDLMVFHPGLGKDTVRRDLRVSLPDRGTRPPAIIDAFLPIGEAATQGRGQGLDVIELTGTLEAATLPPVLKVLETLARRYQKTGGEAYCPLVKDPYRLLVYGALAKKKSKCQSVYETVFAEAQKAANITGDRRPPPKAPRWGPGSGHGQKPPTPPTPRPRPDPVPQR